MSNIINLIFSKNNVFIWNADDWVTLRKEHRIIGELVGCLPKHPRQEILPGLPLLLLPEEVTLLLEKGIAKLVQHPCLQQPPTESLKKKFEEYREALFLEQEQCLREEKQKQIMSVMDKIVEGKKRKMLGIKTNKKSMKKPLATNTKEVLDNIEIDTKDLFDEQMAKLPKLDKNEQLIQTHTAYPWIEKDDFKTVEWKYPTTLDQQLRYQAFKNLWERGYYVTSGEKFGGDFLAYPGDPIMFHSQFIVQCRNRNEEISIIEFIGQCRIGSHVRKTLVFATFSEDNKDIKYHSVQWAENNILEKG